MSTLVNKTTDNTKLKFRAWIVPIAAMLLAVAGPIACSSSKTDTSSQPQATPAPTDTPAVATATPTAATTPTPPQPATAPTPAPVAQAQPTPVGYRVIPGLVISNQCLLREDFEQARRSSVRARVTAGIPSWHLDAEGPLKAFGAGNNEVMEGTLAESFASGGNDRNGAIQLSITPTAMVTIEKLVGGKPPAGTHSYTIQGTCTGHSITGIIEKISQVSIQLSR